MSKRLLSCQPFQEAMVLRGGRPEHHLCVEVDGIAIQCSQLYTPNSQRTRTVMGLGHILTVA